ncbi:MAG TPA: hypothetical protein VHK67_04905 [Rhabdochlamydiaceae bacterium]|nr:hypothetical protein [Rhabdochlamydiaceae bacterium]
MKTPNVNNIAASPVNYFLQSSWQGKVVQVLCVVSFCTLIYFIVSLRKGFFRDSSAASLSGRVQPANPVEIKELPKPDVTYVSAYPAVWDFFKSSEFGTWLSDTREVLYKDVCSIAEDKSSERHFWSKMLECVTLLEAEIDRMVPVFQRYPNIKTDEWGAFRTEYRKIAVAAITAKESCAKLKEGLDKLQVWNQALQEEMRARASQQVASCVNVYPHYEFTHLQTQYFHYLGLLSKEDFSRLLLTEWSNLAKVGLVEMKDVDALELRTMMPWIERLRQLFGVMESEKNEATLRPLINEAIEKCRGVLTSSDNLSDHLENKKELSNHVKQMRTLLGNLSRDDTVATLQLNEIEAQDIARQLILLKGYLHQQNLVEAWKAHNNISGVTRLADYADRMDRESLALLYQMGK